jgi:hypothetical protein
MSRLKRLIQEIHWLSLWQVLGIYLGGAWVALQGIDALAEASSDAIYFVSWENRDDRRHSNTRHHRPPTCDRSLLRMAVPLQGADCQPA